MQSLEELIDKAVPRDIRLDKQLNFDAPLGRLFSGCRQTDANYSDNVKLLRLLWPMQLNAFKV